MENKSKYITFYPEYGKFDYCYNEKNINENLLGVCGTKTYEKVIINGSEIKKCTSCGMER